VERSVPPVIQKTPALPIFRRPRTIGHRSNAIARCGSALPDATMYVKIVSRNARFQKEHGALRVVTKKVESGDEN
jgi:hypothetical protein